MKRLIGSLMAVVMMSSVAGAAGLYSTSFETSENAAFTAGSSLNGIDGWVLSNAGAETNPSAQIQAGTAAQGAQFVRLDNGAEINRSFSNDQQIAARKDVVWVEGYFRGEGSDMSLADAIQSYEEGEASAIVHFSKTNGIEFYNGNGSGGGTAVQSGINSLSAATWYKITIRLNFGAKKWDVWVTPNGGSTVTQTNMGFRDNAITELRGFKNLAQAQADFDAFRVASAISGDANGDASIDTADVIAVLDNISSGEDDIIVRSNGDVNASGGLEQGDVDEIVDRILQVPG